MLQTEDLSVTYPGGARPALAGVSLSLAAGEAAALMGDNGAGKTTLLLALVGAVASTGRVRVDGVTLSRRTRGEIRRLVGLVFQNPDDQLFLPRVLDDVAFGPRHMGLSEAEAVARAEETLDALGIAALAERSPLRLSGGEKRLAALAAVLAMRPRVLLLDEPTAFLDRRARARLTEILRELSPSLTMLVATHDEAFAAAVCGRTLWLEEGRLLDARG